MKHQEANSREVEKRRLQEAIHLVRKMRRRENKAFNSLLFKSTASWPPPLSAPLDPHLFSLRLQSLAVFSYLLVILEVLFYESGSLVQDQ